MNHLNSVLLEGKVAESPDVDENATRFVIGNTRRFVADGKGVSQESFFDIEAWDELGKRCASLEEG